MEFKGKIVVITGASSGLGQAAAIDFAARGARVVVVGRDIARCADTLKGITEKGGDGVVVTGDVSTKAGVKATAAAILAVANDGVDVLFNNAGGTFDTAAETADGVDNTFALNTLGAFLLERALHAALAKRKGRVVNLSTGFLNNFKLDVEDLVAPKKYSGFSQYGKVKLASVLMTVEQAQRFANDSVTAVSMHPGIILGTRFNGGTPKVMQAVGGPILRAVGLACTIDEAQRRFREVAFGDVGNGSYVVNGKKGTLPKQATDPVLRGRLMALLDGYAA